MLEQSGWVDSPATYGRSHFYETNDNGSICEYAIRLREEVVLSDPPANACKLCLQKVNGGGK
jgi:hypothetical protein